MRKSVILILLLLLISCQTKQDKLIGHWHEYKTNNPENIINCYRITDSLIVVNALSDEDLIGYRRGVDIKKSEIISWSMGYLNTISNFEIVNDKLIFDDSIYWKKTADNEQYFQDEFSVGLMVNIDPPETSNLKFDYRPDHELMKSYIYVGKVKSYLLESYDLFKKDEYYLQLNDKISKTEDLSAFLICYHCDRNEQIVFIHADKNTPKSFLIEIENELANIGIPKKHIYHLNININEFQFGYNY